MSRLLDQATTWTLEVQQRPVQVVELSIYQSATETLSAHVGVRNISWRNC